MSSSSRYRSLPDKPGSKCLHSLTAVCANASISDHFTCRLTLDLHSYWTISHRPLVSIKLASACFTILPLVQTCIHASFYFFHLAISSWAPGLLLPTFLCYCLLNSRRRTRSSAVAETARHFVSLNILLSHSRSFEVTPLSMECVSPYP